jgi:leucyl-tRNA synthetase
MSETTPAAAEAAATEPFRYGATLAAEIESRWQDVWEKEGTFNAPNPAGALADAAAGDVVSKPHSFIMDMFPYPSGSGLHVGHPLGYIATDVYARYQRMTGHNVLHTLGYDAFGLPAEQHAVATGQHPRITTEAAMANMRQQLRRLGLGHDPRRVDRHHRPGVLPLDPVDLPADLQLLVRPGGRPGPPDRRAGRAVRVR